jgi:twinkle protein
MIVRLGDIVNQVEDLINNPSIVTYPLQIEGFDQYYKVVLGSTTYIIGIPSHGKSEWHQEMLIRLTELYGFRHLLYSPETGSAAKIYLELCSKILKKPYKDGAFNKLTIDDFRNNIAYIQDYFIVKDQGENSPTFEELFNDYKAVAKNQKIHTVSIDPFNEMMHSYEGRQDIYLENLLGNIRVFSRANNIHTFIVIHPRTLQKNKEGRYDPPTAYEASGGSMFYNKGESIICVYRENEFSENFNERCMAKIIVQKAKPKEVGQKGIFEVKFNTFENRYNYGYHSETNQQETGLPF